LEIIKKKNICPTSYLSCNTQIDSWDTPAIDQNPLTIPIPDLVLGIATKRTELPALNSQSDLYNNVQYLWKHPKYDTELSDSYSYHPEEEEEQPEETHKRRVHHPEIPPNWADEDEDDALEILRRKKPEE